MGLMLSILVFSVGVVEALACVRHIHRGILPAWSPHHVTEKLGAGWRNSTEEGHVHRVHSQSVSEPGSWTAINGDLTLPPDTPGKTRLRRFSIETLPQQSQASPLSPVPEPLFAQSREEPRRHLKPAKASSFEEASFDYFQTQPYFPEVSDKSVGSLVVGRIQIKPGKDLPKDFDGGTGETTWPIVNIDTVFSPEDNQELSPPSNLGSRRVSFDPVPTVVVIDKKKSIVEEKEAGILLSPSFQITPDWESVLRKALPYVVDEIIREAVLKVSQTEENRHGENIDKVTHVLEGMCRDNKDVLTSRLLINEFGREPTINSSLQGEYIQKESSFPGNLQSGLLKGHSNRDVVANTGLDLKQSERERSPRRNETENKDEAVLAPGLRAHGDASEVQRITKAPVSIEKSLQPHPQTSASKQVEEPEKPSEETRTTPPKEESNTRPCTERVEMAPCQTTKTEQSLERDLPIPEIPSIPMKRSDENTLITQPVHSDSKQNTFTENIIKETPEAKIAEDKKSLLPKVEPHQSEETPRKEEPSQKPTTKHVPYSEDSPQDLQKQPGFQSSKDIQNEENLYLQVQSQDKEFMLSQNISKSPKEMSKPEQAINEYSKDSLPSTESTTHVEPLTQPPSHIEKSTIKSVVNKVEEVSSNICVDKKKSSPEIKEKSNVEVLGSQRRKDQDLPRVEKENQEQTVPEKIQTSFPSKPEKSILKQNLSESQGKEKLKEDVLESKSKSVFADDKRTTKTNEPTENTTVKRSPPKFASGCEPKTSEAEKGPSFLAVPASASADSSASESRSNSASTAPQSSPSSSSSSSNKERAPARPQPAQIPAQQPQREAFWLIFSGEYTKAMSKDWHSGHFCCWQCDESLTGQRYVLRDDHPYCIKCYESVFANVCEECNRIIGIDSKDLSYKDKHWHEACFLCTKCRVSLVDKQFGSKADKIYCGNCYDAQFASRCDGCGEIFRAGTKKMEYKTRQWHEKCFCCCVCKTAIGTKSFIPREQEIYCAGCYEEKFATRCVKCNKIITSGGVTYKNEPWHRECFTCTHCNTSLAGQRFTSRDEKPYCADCFGELFAKRCTACSKPITGIGGTRFISFEDRHWHNDCFICASCKTSLVGRGFITDAEDIICPECAKQKLM